MTEKYAVSGFFCENTITDHEGRISLINIYPSIFNLTEVPFPMPLGIFVKICPIPPAGTPILLKLMLGSDTLLEHSSPSIAEADPKPDTSGRELSIHMAMKLVLNVGNPGLLELFAQIGDQQPAVAAWAKIGMLESPPAP